MKEKISSNEGRHVDRFQISIVLLFLTLFIILLFSAFYLLLCNDDITTENDQIPGISVLGIIMAGAAIMFFGFIAFGLSSISSFFGSFLGFSSIKYLPTKRMRIWGIIVSVANLTSFIISFIYLLHFSQLFF